MSIVKENEIKIVTDLPKSVALIAEQITIIDDSLKNLAAELAPITKPHAVPVEKILQRDTVDPILASPIVADLLHSPDKLRDITDSIGDLNQYLDL